MSQFFISTKECRVENNRSFYGCFYLGPFDPGQSLTVANALRRTLLSELKGIAIITVEIEGGVHEYSTLPGVRDSVLDILLNLKEIVFQKVSLELGGQSPYNKNFQPQIGYLRVRGPGIVRAKDLKLPPLIKCVDPDQYIATLADNGVLNMKFYVSEGKNYTIQKPNVALTFGVNKKNALYSLPYPFTENQKLLLDKFKQLFYKNRKVSLKNQISKKQVVLWFSELQKNFLHRTSLLELRQDPKSEKPIAILGRAPSPYKKKLVTNNLKSSSLIKKNRFISNGFIHFDNPLHVDAIFSPINKVNYIIEVNPHKMVQNAFSEQISLTQYENDENVEIDENDIGPNVEPNFELGLGLKGQSPLMRSIPTRAPYSTLTQKKNFLPTTNQIEDIIHLMSSAANTLLPYGNTTPSPMKTNSFVNQIQQKSNLLNVKQQFDGPNTIETFSNSIASTLQLGGSGGDAKHPQPLELDKGKHNIILEVWTNGSIHPRQAVYTALKNLVKLFTKLEKINIMDKIYKSPRSYQKSFQKIRTTGIAPQTQTQPQTQVQPQENLDYIAINPYKRTKILKINKPQFKILKKTAATHILYSPNNLFRRHQGFLGLGGFAPDAPNLRVRGLRPLNPTQKKQKQTKTQSLSLSQSNLFASSPTSNDKFLQNLCNIDIGTLNLSLRTYTWLKRKKINTIADLVKISLLGERLLLDSNNLFNRKNIVREIEKSLSEIGLKLTKS